ncbi:MAG TPA: amidohydrolase family protein [Niabella sp.]|nr:amidohydrolase [Chitinophagaceae bacterium]HRO85197.1 amidohydrolase family protein [Niabella sp.]HUN02328.1 amidohydrolase family protein [Niabella sp.]
MYTVIDAHAHLWLKQDTLVDGLPIKTLTNGRSLFMGETRQMLPPFMVDGQNTAEVFLSNMDYAQVAAAVITQEYIDGNQSPYLAEVQKKYPERFLCCGLIDVWQPDYVSQAKNAIEEGFRAIKIPANRIFSGDKRIYLTDNNLMQVFALMQERQMILSIDLADGDMQVSEMQEVIASFPELKITIGHFGMVTRANWQEQIKLARHKNVMIESGGITWLFNDEFYPFTGAVWAIKEAISLVGIEKLMWGSDYPRTITAITYKMSFDFILKSNLLLEEEKQLFLGENAIGFYGFNNLPQLPYIKNMCE